jgi:hypothetical protein
VAPPGARGAPPRRRRPGIAGKLEALINVAVVSHHLIEFTRDCLRGEGEASFYAPETPAPRAM